MKGEKVMKRFRYLALVLSLVLVLPACQLSQQIKKQPAQPTRVSTASHEKGTPTAKAAQTEQAGSTQTQAPEKANSEPVVRPKPPQSRAAEIRPIEMRTEVTHLTNLIGYQVLDENGNKLGVASDYIVNACETYIIYILMEPVDSLNVAPGRRVVIPFEAVTINSGVLDAQNKTIQLRLIPEQFPGAPTFPAGQQLTPTDWEGAVRAFWSKAVRIGKLATSCNVPDGPVYKVAYATQLLKVNLYDQFDKLLGTIQDAVLEPESGKIGFYIVQPANIEGLVMVESGVVNIPKEALLPGGELTLVLLADSNVFWDAPHITTAGEADDFTLQSKMRQYWGR
jgi:sporulation protein YlmC with PRC-barrel domain